MTRCVTVELAECLKQLGPDFRLPTGSVTKQLTAARAELAKRAAPTRARTPTRSVMQQADEAIARARALSAVLNPGKAVAPAPAPTVTISDGVRFERLPSGIIDVRLV